MQGLPPVTARLNSPLEDWKGCKGILLKGCVSRHVSGEVNGARHQPREQQAQLVGEQNGEQNGGASQVLPGMEPLLVKGQETVISPALGAVVKARSPLL